MIPVIIVLALVAGLFRLHWATIPVLAALWVFLLLSVGDDSIETSTIVVGGFILGLLNAGPGYGLGRGIRTMVETVRRDVSDHLATTREAESGDSQ